MKSKTRAISEGAMMLAIIGMMLALNRQFAGVFELMMFLLSIPIVIYTVKYGIKMGMTLCVSALFMSFLFATITSIFYLLCAIMIGLVYAFGIIHNWKNQWLLFASVIGNFVVTVITVLMLGAVFGYDIEEEIAVFMKLMPDTGSINMKQMVSIVVFLSYFMIAVLQAMLIHILSIELMRRFKIKTLKMKNVFEIMFPRWSALVIVVTFIVYFVATYMKLDKSIMDFIIVLYCCALMLCLFNGCITIICYLRLAKKGKGFIFVVMIACFIPILQIIIGVIGVLDIWQQFRRKMKEGVLNEIH